jgi:twinkle protein
MLTFDWGAIGVDLRGAKGSGAELKTTCPSCSYKRKKVNDACLNINIETGLAHCWHCEENFKAPEVGGEAKYIAKPTPKVYTKPTFKPSSTVDSSVVDWFVTRGISIAVIERYRISKAKEWMPQVGKEISVVAFPYFDGEEVINIKFRSRDKQFKMSAGAKRVLYGLNDIAETTIIVEGEMDKLSLAEAGLFHAVSVPEGAPSPNTKNFDSKFDYLNTTHLEAVKTWIIAVDNDAPGNCLRDELIRRFGAENCKVVTWPDGCKDANDVLLAYGGEVLSKTIDGAIPVPIAGVFTASELASELFDLYENGMPRGASTGWAEMDELYTVMPGQLNIVTGIPGHGKSEWVDALAVNLAHLHGWHVGFYTPENFPIKLHVAKIAEKFTGKPFNPGRNERMSKAEFSESMDWIDGKFKWIMPEAPSLTEIMNKARALVARDGIRMLVIDPWNEVEHDRPLAMSETEYISLSLSMLRKFARKHEVAIFVIAHPKLMAKDKDGVYPVPNPYDINGSANWRNKADNCITIWRNLKEESAFVEVHVQKIKFKIVGKLGKVDFRYDRISGRYHGNIITKAPIADFKVAATGETEDEYF